MKKFTTVVLLALLWMNSHAQQNHSYNSQAPLSPVNSKTPGLTDLVEKDDDFSGNILYYDSRTSIHSLKGSGIFATILKTNGEYKLYFTAYHSLARPYGSIDAPQTTPIQVSVILIKTSDTLFTFRQRGLISGNGTGLTEIRITGDSLNKNNFAYKLLSKIIATGYCKMRFESIPGIDDYVLSDREVSEIKAVVKAWLTVNHIE